MLRIHNVKVKLGQTNYSKVLSQVLNVREKEIQNIRLAKRSVDARRQTVHWICSFDFEVLDEDQWMHKYPRLQKVKPYYYQYLPSNDQRVVVVGSGPAGLFCAYVLAHCGQNVTVIERGKKVEERIKDVDILMQQGILNPNSNIAFGEGGAGTFSDGKLTTGIKNPRLQYILETFVKHGAPDDIMYESKPHIGTDYLRKVLVSMRHEMEKMGVQFLFETQMIDFQYQNQVYKIQTRKHDQEKTIEADVLVLAIGHSARDTYEMLYHKGLPMLAKPFAVGLRIEQSQEKINQIQYKQSVHSPHLKAAPYKLAVQTSEGRGVYTFCMCPGGYVVPSQHEEGTICVNGMSYYARDAKNANSAILVNVSPDDFEDDHPLAGMAFQRQLEQKAFLLGGGNYRVPVQRVLDYIDNQIGEIKELKPSFQFGYQLANLNNLFPDYINRNLKEGLLLMNQKMPGFIDETTLLTGVEARSSAPVRIVRNQQLESDFSSGLYPIGEGAGYAGGIMSAAVDGMMCAEMILGEDKHGSN